MASELDEIRQQFPDYANWSDQKLGRALKKKAQPDMPDEQYWAELGVDPNALTLSGKPFPESRNEQQFQPSDYQSPGEAVVEGGMRIPEKIGGMVKGIATGVADLPNNSISDYGNSAMQGLAGGAEVLANVPNNFVEYLRKHQQEQKTKKSEFEQNHPMLSKVANLLGRTSSEDEIQIPDWVKAWKPGKETTQTLKDAQKYWEPENPEAPANQLIKGVSQFVPSLIATGGNPYAAAVVNSVGENKNVFEDLVPFLAAEKGMQAVGKGVSKVKDKFSLEKKVADQAAGLLSPEELARNVQAAEGTHTDIGNVVGSPELAHKLSNEILPQANDAVVDSIMRKREQEVQQRAEQTGNKAAQGKLTDVDLNPLVENLTQAAKKESEFVKNELYRPVDKLAKAEGITLELPTFKRIAAEDAAAIDKSPMLEANSKFKARYNKLLGLQKTENITHGKIVDKSGKPISQTIETSSISEAKSIFNDLYSEGLRMEKSESAIDRATGKLYKRLANAGNADIQAMLKSKGSPKIQDTYEKAQEHYRSDFSRFLDKDIRKFLDENKDYDSIVHDIIKPSKIKDQFSQIEKIVDILPENQKHLLGAAYLQKAFDPYGVLQPTEMANLWNKLGKRQQQALFPDPALRQSIRDFINLKDMNADALNKWFNPKTGAKNQGMIAKVMEAIKGGGIGGTIGGTIGTVMGGPVGGIIGGVGGTIAGKTISKASNTRLAKLYTSPEFRQAVLDRMQKKGGGRKKANPVKASEFSKILRHIAKKFAIAETASAKENE